MQTLFRTLLLAAQHRIRIATAYFVPSPDLRRLMVEASERRVEVEVMHPGPHIDHRVSQLAGETVYHELIESGVKIWRYQPTMFHTKAVTVDGVLSCIGSTNLNYRSLRRDDEVAVTVLDRDFTQRLDRDFEEDRDRCKLVERWPSRGPLHRAAEYVAQLVRHEV